MAETPLRLLPNMVDMNKSGKNSEGTVYVYLTTRGANISLERQNIRLRDGIALNFYSDDGDGYDDRDDLIFQGEVHYSAAQGWYAQVPWDAIKNLSEIRWIRTIGRTQWAGQWFARQRAPGISRNQTESASNPVNHSFPVVSFILPVCSGIATTIQSVPGPGQRRLRETVRPIRHLPHLNAVGEESWLRP